MFSRPAKPGPYDDTYASLVDVVDAALDYDEIAQWLCELETQPPSTRLMHLAQKHRTLKHNGAPQDLLDILQLLNNDDILRALNVVIRTLAQNEHGACGNRQPDENLG